MGGTAVSDATGFFIPGAPFTQVVSIDFETYWHSVDYTLSKMTTEEYVRDERFKAHGAVVHVLGSGSKYQWYDAAELPRILGTFDWTKTAILAHNAQFDVTILEWVYDVHPCFIFDTLSMARALRGVEVGNSLAKLAKDFGLPDKGVAVHNTNGVRDVEGQMLKELADYCAHDTYLCEEIFARLWMRTDPEHGPQGPFPQKELRLIDMTIKMYTRPTLELDKAMLEPALIEEAEKRTNLLVRLDVDEASLASNPKFAEMLRSLGVDPPMKISKQTGKPALALAKTDAHFQALLHGENEDVSQLCEARLMVKSTGERTRAQRLLDISKRGRMPIPLSYFGAKSGRWSAAKGGSINVQNFKRGSFLRKAIMAPQGYQIAVGDLSQIEPRVLAWMADYHEMLGIFKTGADPYAAFGATMFNIPGLTKTSHPLLRQSAKSALLGAGYQLGWASFAAQLLVGFLGAPPVRYTKEEAKALGVTRLELERALGDEHFMATLEDIPHTCSTDELFIHALAARAIINKYRAAAWPVVALWKLCEALLLRSLVEGEEYAHKCLVFRKEELVLPSGMSIRYPNLRQKKDDRGRTQWVYGPDATTLYAGKIVNNLTQGTARCIMSDGMLRVQKRYPVVGTVHDELLCLVPDAEAEAAKDWVLEQMVVEPKYMPGIPLAADGGVHRRYGEAKQ